MKTKIAVITIIALLISVSFSFATMKSDIKHEEKLLIDSGPTYSETPEPRRIEIPVDAKKSLVPKTSQGNLGGRVTGDLLWEDNFEGGATVLSYWANVYYIWDCPDEYGDEIFAMRMTPLEDCNLDGADIMVYDAYGSPDLRVHVYTDDGTGLPDTELGFVDVSNANLNYYPDFTYVDLSSLGLSFLANEDFHVGVSTAGTDTLVFVSDDGSSATGRGTEYWGVWATMLDDWGVDVAFLIDAYVTYPAPEPWTDPSNEWQFVEIIGRPDPQSPDAAHSPTHCWWVAEDSTFAPKSQLLSPWMTLPSSHAQLFLQFWYFNNLIDWDGDDDGTLEDYFKVYVADDSCSWHISSHNAYSGNSWWCGSEVYQKYGTYEFYNLTSPEIELGAGGTLTFKTYYDIELPTAPPEGFDAWDVCNVQISEDGGLNWDFLIPTTPPYDADSSYAYFANTGQTGYYPGWVGWSEDWIDAEFDLSSFTGNIQLRWVVASDPASTEEGFFIDNVEVTDDTRAIVFEDNADTEIHLIPDPAVPYLGDELTYDYWQAGDTVWVLEDDDQIWNGSLNISGWIGEDVQIVIEVINDFNHDGGEGEGFWLDDVQLIGSNLPEHDMGAVFNVIPYPTTAGVDLVPGIVYGNFGLTTEAPQLRMNIIDFGHPLFDFYNNATDAIGCLEYGFAWLEPNPLTDPLEAGIFDFEGWTTGITGDADPTNDTTYFYGVDVYPTGEYELGYNSREWDGTYYTSTLCGSYFTPFSDEVLSSYTINSFKTLLINYGDDYATDTETFEIYEAINDTTTGALIYSESFDYTGGLNGEYEWAEFPLTTPQTLTSDFFVIISGTWWTDPDIANYYPLFDAMVRQYLLSGAYTEHTVYWDVDALVWAHSSGDRFVNTIGTGIPPSGYDISGNIAYYDGAGPIPDADVALTGDDTFSTATTASGDYLFNNIPGGNYVSTPSKDEDLGGLSGMDASRIARFAAGLYTLDCLEMIAGDVSMNGYISGMDASRVARYAAGLLADLNTSGINWVFTPEPIPNCDTWPPIVYENTREYTPLDSDLIDEDFIGIRLGDVSGNWSPGLQGRLPESPTELTEIDAKINSTLRIPVVVDEIATIEGIDISIAFDSKVLSITGLTLNDGILAENDYAVESNLKEGRFVIYAQRELVSEAGAVAFVEFDVIGKSGSKSDVYFIKFDVNETEATGGFSVLDSEGSETISRGLEVNVIQTIPEKFALYQNYPNPFNTNTLIKYDLPKDAQVSIQIYNIKGQLVEELVNGFETAGGKEIEWNADKNVNGIYFLKMETKNNTFIKKMILMK